MIPRTEYAYRSVLHYGQYKGITETDDQIIALLSDLVYLCDEYGLNFHDEAEKALTNHQQENSQQPDNLFEVNNETINSVD